MPVYPHCHKCLVVKGLTLAIKEYHDFLREVKAFKGDYRTEHARGNHYGRVNVLEEVICDLEQLLPYLETERAIPAGR